MAIYKDKEITNDGRSYFFMIGYTDVFGVHKRYRSKKYKTKKECELEESNFKIKVNKQDYSTFNLTLDQIFKEYIFQHGKEVKPQTIKKDTNLFRYLEPIKDKKINDIDLSAYRVWRNYIDDIDMSIENKKKIVQLFKRLIAYSNKYYNTSDYIMRYVDPVKSVNVFKKEMDFYTFEEYQLFSEQIEDIEFKTFMDILYYCGLRQGEAQALTWKDISNNVSISKTLTSKIKGKDYVISTPKTINSNRVLPLTELLLDELKILKNKQMEDKHFKETWFVFGGTIPFKESTICNRKNKYCDKAHLRRIRIHDFRHSCASLLINKGATIMLVSKWLGHSKVSITLNTYTHMYKNELNNMVEILNKL